MKIVGLTGSIGSGKSQVARYFEECGAKLIDADILARLAVAPESRGLQELVKEFGADILTADGSLDRGKLGAVVFSDESKRKTLEAILHPKIRLLFTKTLNELRKNHPDSIVVAVIPLLFESNNKYDEIESVICVTAPDDVCIKRIMKRDGSNEELATNKLHSQMAQTEKVKRADFHIDNSGSLDSLKKQVQILFQELSNDE